MRRWMVKAGSTSLAGLVLEDVAMPEPGPGEVRVKVHAVSLNRRDHLLLTGQFDAAGQDFVAVSDGAGEIDALGRGGAPAAGALCAPLWATACGAEGGAPPADDARTGRVLALGGSGTVNYRDIADWGRVAREKFGGFDRVVNAAGPGALDQSVAALAAGGEVALMGLYDLAGTGPDFITLMSKGASIRGTSVGGAAAFRDLVAFVDEHGVKPPIARRFAFEDARAAYQAAEAGDAFGKIVIRTAH